MKIKRFLQVCTFVAIILMMAIGLTACKRSASKAPEGVETTAAPGGAGAGVVLPTSTSEGMGIFDKPLTETAGAAEAAADASAGGAEQPAVAVATATPTPEPTQPPPPPPAEIKPPPPTSTPGRPDTYTLHKGEFPFCIARRFNVNQSELLALNGLTLDSKVSVGAVLKIPKTGNPFVGERALKPHPANYTVVAGDTIYIVACKFGNVSPEDIAAVNGLADPFTLTAGQTLKIP